MSDIKLAQARSATEVAGMRPKDQIAYYLNQKKTEIMKMLPQQMNAERLLKVAQIAATTTPALLECDVPSLIGAIGQCAQMGLEPNTVLGHAYLVPFNTKRKVNGKDAWVKSVQVIVGYKGFIDLARRSGQIVSIAAHAVYTQDKFDLAYGLEERLNHIPATGERGEVIGFYAFAKLKDGGHSFEFMTVNQVKKIMKGTQSKGEYGPWKDHFVEMGRKTAIRRLAKFLPLSVEFQTAAAIDGMAEGGKDQRLDTAYEGDYSIINDDGIDYVDQETGEITQESEQSKDMKALPNLTDEAFTSKIDGYSKMIQEGKHTPDSLIAMLSTRNALSGEQIEQIKSIKMGQ